MKDLGETSYLSLNAVFDGEATEFTPWLSDNLDRLALELGFELEPEDTEVSVGSFKADVKAKTTDGRTVVIENQFNNTDHSHLGQLLTYAAGLRADIVIWIAERVREEHRAAVDWLNEKATDADFFAVEARAVKIDDSRPALLWDIVASPNTWSRLTRKTRSDGALTDLDNMRIEYWAQLNERIDADRERLTQFKPDKSSWQGGSIGTSSCWLNTAMNSRDGSIRVEIYLDGAQAKERFDAFRERKEQIEEQLGYALGWDYKEGRQGCRIVIIKLCDPTDRDDWAVQHDWIIEKRLEFEGVFRPLVRELISN